MEHENVKNYIWDVKLLLCGDCGYVNDIGLKWNSLSIKLSKRGGGVDWKA